MKPLLTLLVLAAFTISCRHENEEGPLQTVFTATALLDDGTDCWIVLRDNETGDLIDARQLTSNIPEIFESTANIASGKLAVSFFKASQPTFMTASVYTDVAVGTSWTANYKTPVPQSRNFAGTYRLTITGIPSLWWLTVSDDRGKTLIDYPVEWTEEKIVVDAQVDVSRDGKHLVVVEPLEEDPKYMMIENVEVDKPITVDYDNFLKFDRYVTATFPENTRVFSYVGSYLDATKETSYLLQGQYPAANDTYLFSHKTFGFLNSISNYEVSVSVGDWGYFSRGPAPAAIEFIDGENFSTSVTSIYDYQFSGSKPYVYTNAKFSNYDSERLYLVDYTSPNGNTKFFDAITPEIAAKYLINPDALQYHYTLVTVVGRPYNDALRSLFDPGFDSYTPFEQVVVAVK